MKKSFVLVVALLATHILFAQTQFEVSRDATNGQKILKGILSRDLLLSDTAFAWMKNDISWYKPNAACVASLTPLKDSIQLVIFIGTWCEDSQIVLPQLLKLLDQIKYNMNRLTIIGVDRNKHTLGALSEALGITKAPTILVMKNGKEFGRVEEFGKYGVYDQELAEILAKIK